MVHGMPILMILLVYLFFLVCRYMDLMYEPHSVIIQVGAIYHLLEVQHIWHIILVILLYDMKYLFHMPIDTIMRDSRISPKISQIELE